MPAQDIPYAKQSIDESDIQCVAKSLKEELITRGPLVQRFEEEIAHYCDAPYAVAFNSGTSALMAAYFAARLSPHDRVISTPNTFIATVGAPIQLGISPTFADIDPSTGNMDLHALSNLLRYRPTRGRPFIVPVHFSGIAVDMAKVDQLINHPEAVVIEDAAHAIGSTYPSGEKVGSCAFSHMTIFSFHPAKTITTGEGGMVTTKEKEFYHRLQLYRNNGIERNAPYLLKPEAPGYYEVHHITGNFNFTSFQAALGLNQLKRIDNFISKRRLLVKRYRRNLAGIANISLLTDVHDEYTAFHLFPVQIDFQAFNTTREKLMQALQEKGIGSQVHYIPLYRHPVLGKREDDFLQFPKTELYYQQALSLPLYYDLTESQVDLVCHELVKNLGKTKTRYP